MPEPTDAGAHGPGGSQRRALPLSARTVRIISLVLVVLLVLATGAALWLGLKTRAADERQKERAAAASVASQFALRMDNVDGAKFDAYIKGINKLLTTKAKAKNEKTVESIRKSYEAAKVKGTGKVLLTAVGDADDDSAIVLVVHDASVSTTQGKIEHHYRWSVNVVKVGDSWLVDDFNPVN